MDLRLHMNSQCIKLIRLDGGYRSWTIEYSHGLMPKTEGGWKNLWHWPTFHKADVRKIQRGECDA